MNYFPAPDASGRENFSDEQLYKFAVHPPDCLYRCICSDDIPSRNLNVCCLTATPLMARGSSISSPQGTDTVAPFDPRCSGREATPERQEGTGEGLPGNKDSSVFLGLNVWEQSLPDHSSASRQNQSGSL